MLEHRIFGANTSDFILFVFAQKLIWKKRIWKKKKIKKKASVAAAGGPAFPAVQSSCAQSAAAAQL
jgi:hypothetical protein